MKPVSPLSWSKKQLMDETIPGTSLNGERKDFQAKMLWALGLGEDRQKSSCPHRWVLYADQQAEMGSAALQLTQTGEERQGQSCLCKTGHGRHVEELPTLGASLLAVKQCPVQLRRGGTQKAPRCSVFVEIIWVSQTYHVPYAGASRAVILPLWRQQLKVPLFRELSISFMFLSTFNPLETQ